MEGIEEDIEVVEEDERRRAATAAWRRPTSAPVVKLVNTLLADAVRKGASDIHIEPYEKNLRVRYRIDGVLQEMMAPPFKLKTAIISRLKIMAELDIAERRMPQDGRIKIKVLNRKIDLRVSTLPDDLRREDRDAYPRQGRTSTSTWPKLGFEPQGAATTSRAPSPARTAWCWSPARPARARRRRSTRPVADQHARDATS